MKRLGFGGKYEFCWRKPWSSHTLGFPSVCSNSRAKPLNTTLSSSGGDAPEQTCPGSSISFSHWAPLMWIQCCSAYHSCLKVQLPQYSRVWSFTYCRCYNVIIWELVMHYTFFIKEHHHLKVKCGKVSASRYILTETVSETSGCGTKTLLLSWAVQNQHYIFPLKGVNIQINRVEYHLTRTCHAIMKPI